MPEPWDLPDEQLWGQLDASLLEDEFRASEAAERPYWIGPQYGACASFVRILIDSVFTVEERTDIELRYRVFMQELVNTWAARLAAEDYPEKPSRPRRAPSQPRTLHLALQANARPVLNRRAARREWRKQGR